MKLRQLMFLVVAFAPACSGNAPTAVPVDPAIGTYVLVTANGVSIPAVLKSADPTTVTTVLDGTLYLAADGTYTSGVQMSVRRSGTTTIVKRGIPDGTWYRASASRLFLLPTASGPDQVFADVTATTMVLSWMSVGYGYTR